jgi:hypothetical protein
MESIGKFVVGAVIVLVLGTGLWYALSYSLRDFHNSSLAATVGLSSQPVAVAPVQIRESGTIVYYVQQGVEVPYLMSTNGTQTYSRALAFDRESICVTAVEAPCDGSIDSFKAAYGSGPVYVQGIADDESLIVTRISRLPF